MFAIDEQNELSNHKKNLAKSAICYAAGDREQAPRFDICICMCVYVCASKCKGVCVCVK